MPNPHVLSRPAIVAALFSLSLLVAGHAHADSLTLAWDPNPEVEVIGYYVFIGTEPGVYSTVTDVGNVTTYTFGNAKPGSTYYLTVAAYAPGPVVGAQAAELVSAVVPASGSGSTPPPPSTPPISGSLILAPSTGRAAPPTDSMAPIVVVTGPTSATTFSTTSDFITLSGTATDNVGVDHVTWTNDRGGSGDVAGTKVWSVIVPLQPGTNVITITALDAAAQLGVVNVTVTMSSPTTTPAPLAPTRPTTRRRFGRL